MSIQAQLGSLLRDGYTLREADRDILSVLPDAAAPHPFDRWALAATYDRVVATRLYNRIVWGTTPADYVGFEQRALESDAVGWMLDAACGSLVFTGDLFARHLSRRVVLLDPFDPHAPAGPSSAGGGVWARAGLPRALTG